MSNFKNINTFALANIDKIKRPSTATKINLDSLAREVFTDFATQNPLMLEQSTSIDEAAELMKRAHVKLKLVINAEEVFEGVITLSDLQSVKVMRAQEVTGLRRGDLTVADVMTPKEQLHAIDSSEFVKASVGDILATMKKNGEQHVLVADARGECICGIVSANDIARRLQVPVFISERANTFAEIYKVLHP